MTKSPAAQLFELIAFDRPLEGDNNAGGTVAGGWSEEFRCRAGFTRLRGGETVLAARLEGTQPTVIRVRANSSTDRITTDWRVRCLRESDGKRASWDADELWTGEVFNVRSIIKTEDRRYYDITAESGVAV